MARRKVDTGMLTGLVTASQTQEVSRGIPRTYDKNFPIFPTPVNTTKLVYIPTTNVRDGENGKVMDVLHAHIHQAQIGKSFTSLRCISNLQGNEFFDHLGYDGTCPACEAVTEVWELYNIRMKARASEIGVDPNNDPTDMLKPVREELIKEMQLKGSEAYVTFPIVVIPTVDRFRPTEDAHEKLELYFVNWREQRYKDSILKALEQLVVNPGHPGGQLMLWDFTYDTKGKQANAMMSAKNAKYGVIQDQTALQYVQHLIPIAEQKASTFTLQKAAEVVVANEFLYKEDLLAEVNKVMTETRKVLELSKTGGAVQPQLGGGQQAPALGNPLANFGMAQPQGDVGVAPQTQAQPVAQAQPQFAQPVVEQPQFAQPVVEQPQFAQPVVEQPQFAQPVVEQPQFVQQPVVEQPQYAQQPVVEQPQVAQPQFAQPQANVPQV